MITLTTTNPALIAALTPDVTLELDGVPHTVAAVGQREDGASVIRLRSAREGPELIQSEHVRIRALVDIEDDLYKDADEGGNPVERTLTLAKDAETTVPWMFARTLASVGRATILPPNPSRS